MKFTQLAQQFALKFAQTHPELDAQILAERACEYANVLAQEIAKRLPPVPPPVGFDAQELIAKSNALFDALGWNPSQSRQWLAQHFNGKNSRLKLTDQELQQMLLLLIDELAKTQREVAR
jgi:hypothetical protein